MVSQPFLADALNMYDFILVLSEIVISYLQKVRKPSQTLNL